MFKKYSWQILLGVALIAASAIVYYTHYLIFHDAHHIFIYMVGDIAFVFIEVLLVTLILHQLLMYREKRSMLKKLNMVIGAFFSEVGTELLERFVDMDENAPSLKDKLIVNADWDERRFASTLDAATGHDPKLDLGCENLSELRDFLLTKREFMLRLLENPNLLEHESFTDLLWATFHLTEELANRKDLAVSPPADLEHLRGDIRRAYGQLAAEWVRYMRHLKQDYPYLFSLAMRTNPFDPAATVQFE